MSGEPVPIFAERAGRPVVMGRHWCLASGHPLASWAGARVLEEGGSAADAAVAVAAVLNVVEPHMSGLGGDLFALVADMNTGRVWAINGTGSAPLEATAERYRAGIPERGPSSVSVPGAGRAWDLLHRRWGKLPLARLLGPAIELAAGGFPVSHNLAAALAAHRNVLSAFPDTARIFLPYGELPRSGQPLRQPELARTLETLATSGFASLYEGELAERLVRSVRSAGGLLSAESLALARAEVLEPLALRYRDWTVWAPPPNSSAHTVLAMLGMLDCLPLADWKPLSAELLHVMIEAKKLAFRDRERFTADPRFGQTLPSEALDPARLRRLAASIDLRRARPGPQPDDAPGTMTTSFSVIDPDGLCIVVTASLNMAFGSGFVAGDTGILLNNRMLYWHLEPSHPNRLEPGKRVRHTLSPILAATGPTVLGLGTPGGDAQPQILVHVLVHLLEYGLSLQEAVELPRWRHRGIGQESNWPHGTEDVVEVEGRLPNATIEGLQARGHFVRRLARWGPIGSCQVVRRDGRTGVVEAAADPRSDAYALAW
ncbi:MAG: gamma-glutamyltransferase family protein [Thermomicrobium sp.]|nr:gamma-glutamyltransferase family protein [Thermomicrobium sp.]